jgi:uncharacterized membrane protein YkvA (DUF1232 family)
MTRLEGWRQRVKELKTETYAIYLAYQDPRVPWYAKILIVLVVAYTFSPIDLIPDFIPVIGYLDDLIIIPLGILLVLKMIPPVVIAECRVNARTKFDQDPPNSLAAVAVILVIWILAAAVIITIAFLIFNK